MRQTFDELYFDAACDALLRAVHAGASADWFDGVDPTRRAVVLAQHAMREARRLGRYPSTHQLELEARRAA